MKRPIAQLSATGRGIPDRVMTNHDFAAIGIETTHEWIIERTGISERRIAGEGETTCSMAATAARQAMERAGVQAGELDIVMLTTATPDRLLPATAVDLQAELGAKRAAAFDLSAACAGFVYALTVAEGLIAAGSAETILVCGSEKMSAIVDWTDRSTCVLFGDGAGAAVVQRSRQGRGILGSFIRSDGQLADLLYRPAGGASIPFSQQVLTDRTFLVKMAGRETFKHAVRSMSEAADRALDAARVTSADVDLMIPHQANLRIIEATAKHAGIPMDKVYVNVDRYGNTSSASVAIALDEAIERGVVGEGSTVMLVAFGAGFTWASSVIRL
ncbi:MAG TPA: beta-ketoacyl-ACP synthase III [Gemmatimonadaceae bacterium]|nr:beta-ketoacyl-ACP synthase III [Gemmatimonadaceae bacterium]